MAVLMVAAMILSCSMVEGRALLNLGKLIDHLIDCPPPPTDVEALAPEPYYSGPPADVITPAPVAYDTPAYPSPPGPPAPYASGPIPEPSPVYQSPPAETIPEPSPEYQTPPAGGY